MAPPERTTRLNLCLPPDVQENPELAVLFTDVYVDARKAQLAEGIAAEARRAMGSKIRENWDLITQTRNVSALADAIGVGRTFLYRVQNGDEWI
jgi:hypothetical protein